MLYRRKRPLIFRKSFWTAATLAVLFCFAVHAFEEKASVFGKNYLPNFARQITTDAVTKAVCEELEKMDLGYGDLCTVVRGTDGDVKAIETDPAQINLLKAKVTKAAQEEIVHIRNSEMTVPLGAFTGLTLLSNHGPPIKLTFCLTGSFDARIESSFESAGINQTVHHIRLILTSHIVTASVDFDREIRYETDFELAQSVIAGQIPSTYGGYLTNIR